MWSTRRAGPRPGSVAAALKKSRNNAKNANAAVRGAANNILNAANAKREANAKSRKNREIINAEENNKNNNHKDRIGVLRDTFKIKREAEETISKSQYSRYLGRINDIAYKLNIEPDERLPIGSIMRLIRSGDLTRAIVKLINGETPEIKADSDLELFFNIYNDFVQKMIEEILKIRGLATGPQRGGAIEVVVISAIVVLVLAAVISRLYTDYFCRFTKHKNAAWCINPKKVTSAEPVTTPVTNPFANGVKKAQQRALIEQTRKRMGNEAKQRRQAAEPPPSFNSAAHAAYYGHS